MKRFQNWHNLFLVGMILISLGVAASCSRNIAVPVSPTVATLTPTNTNTPAFTNTPVFTNTFTLAPTNTFTTAPTNTFTNTITNTPSGPTNTFTNTFTPAPPTNTPTRTFTFTSTNTVTNTFTSTLTPTPTVNPLIIDDFESGPVTNNQILPGPGPTTWNGSWFTAVNPGGAISPAPTSWVKAAGPGNGSTYAAHVTCGSVTQYGNFGFNFLAPAATVNLSAYTGVIFDIKTDIGSGTNMAVAFPDVDTQPTGQGGSCSVSCNGYHQANICMSTSWQSVTVFFSQLSQPSWAPQVAFKPASVVGMSFNFPVSTNMGVWVDNVRLTAAAAPAALSSANVSDFDFNAGGANINPTLTGLVAGNLGWTTYVAPSPAGTQLLPFVQCGGYTPNLVGGAGLFGAEMKATWGPSFAAYSSSSLTANLYNGSTYFDITPFATGVDFWIKVVNLTGTTLGMSIPLASTVPPSNGGTCPGGCWDHFGAPGANIPPANNTWTHETIPFASFARAGGPWPGGWSSSIAPCSNTNIKDGCNNNKVMQLQWAASSGPATTGTVSCDFWVDNVTFY